MKPNIQVSENSFPFASLGLLVFFYLIGLLNIDSSGFSNLSMDTYIIDRSVIDKYTLVPEWTLQWQLFTYHALHFALVHYAYNGVLILYYVQGLERVVGKKFIVIGYLLMSILWPVIAGVLFYLVLASIPSLKVYLLHQGHFLGASIGIWGLIGLSVPSNQKRILFWPGIFILFVPEFTLKLISENKDITSNLAHLGIFFTCWWLARLFIEIENGNGKIGQLKLNESKDQIIVLLIIIHALGLVIYFLDKVGIW
ncbi:MAG: rhomboid family intramembrane serine protease [Candidatus Kariarchaeaceae archaeon]|jgi:membrane associated rhomboid family serine protease